MYDDFRIRVDDRRIRREVLQVLALWKPELSKIKKLKNKRGRFVTFTFQKGAKRKKLFVESLRVAFQSALVRIK
jgi:hypothetical protein